jgi:hypothetical protein
MEWKNMFYKNQKLIIILNLFLMASNIKAFVPQENLQYFISNKASSTNIYYGCNFFSINNQPVSKTCFDSHNHHLNFNISRSMSLGLDISSIIKKCITWYKNKKHLKQYEQKVIEFVQKYNAFTQAEFERNICQEYHLPFTEKCSSFNSYPCCNENHQKILSEFQLYQFEGFKQYIATFNCYSSFIQNLNYQLRNDSICRNLTFELPGFVHKSFESIIEDLYLHEINRISKLNNSLELHYSAHHNINEQLALNDNYQEYIDEINNIPDHLYEARIEKRIKAIKTIEHDQSVQTQTFSLSENAKNDLQAFNHSTKLYRECTGNQLQQVLHSEFVDIINQAAELLHQKNMPYLKPLLFDFTSAGIGFNNNGNMVKASKLADFCWATLEYGKAIGEGAWQGTVNTAQIVLHPIDSAQGIIQGTCTLAYHLAKVLYEVAELNVIVALDEKKGIQKINSFTKKIIAVEKAIEDKLNSTPSTTLVKEGTAFATEWILAGKVLGSASKFFKEVKKCSVEIAKKAGDILDKIPATTLATPEGLQVTLGAQTADGLFNAIETAKNHIGTGTKKLIQLPAGQKLAQIPIEAQNYLTQLESHIPELQRLFNGTKIFIEGIGEITLEIDFKHIFGMDIYVGLRRGIPKQILNGFHLDPLQWIEQNSSIKFLNKKVGPAGSFTADVLIDGVLFEGKSYFPSSWSYETNITKIFESLKNLSETSILQPNGRWILEGYTQEGIKIQTILEKS